MKRITKHPLFPVPKVYVPLVAGWVNFGSQVVATGQPDRATFALLAAATGYAIIGYASPKS